MKTGEAIGNVAIELGKSIVCDSKVINASQKLIGSAVNGGIQIAGAAGATLVTTGNIGAALSAAGTTASSVGASISTGWAGVYGAVTQTHYVGAIAGLFHGAGATGAVAAGTTAAAVAAPFVIGAAILGGLWWLCKD